MMENLWTHDEELMSIYKSRMETRIITSPFFEKQCQKLGTVMYCIWKTQCWRSTKKGLIFKTIRIQLLKHPCEVSHVSQVTKNQQKKKSDWKMCYPTFEETWSNFYQFLEQPNLQRSSRPFFTAPQNLLRSMSRWHWWPARMDEVPPGGGKPSLVIRTTQDMAWTKPGFYGMKLMVFVCSLLLKWAKQNSTPPQPIKNLAVLGRSGNMHLKNKNCLLESTQICVSFLLKLSWVETCWKLMFLGMVLRQKGPPLFHTCLFRRSKTVK